MIPSSNIDILSLWYEGGGLKKMKIEAIFNTFKLISIFVITSVPFWMGFSKEHYDISDISFTIKYWGVWLYYLITYLIMSWFILKPMYKKVDFILKNAELFDDYKLSMETTEGTSLEMLLQISGSTREDFLLEANRMDNILMGLEDKQYLQTIFFNSLLGTFPFEITIRELLTGYFFKDNLYSFKNKDENSRDFTTFSRRVAFVIIPFLPTLLIFSLVNHIVTYIHNGDFLTTYDYNRFGLWKFRHYNEFLFCAKKRLDKSKPIAEAVTINLYLESWKSSFAKGLSFMCSVFSVFLLIFSFNGFERFCGIEIIPLMAVLAAVSSKIFPRARNQEGSMISLKSMLKKELTRYDLGTYFESKLTILFKEVLSILFLPIILFFIIPDRSFFITTFITDYYKEGICTFAKWSNREATPKTKMSFMAMSHDIANSDILLSL